MNYVEFLLREILVRETIYMFITEHVLMFLHIVGHNVRFRVVVAKFQKSIETIH